MKYAIKAVCRFITQMLLSFAMKICSSMSWIQIIRYLICRKLHITLFYPFSSCFRISHLVDITIAKNFSSMVQRNCFNFHDKKNCYPEFNCWKKGHVIYKKLKSLSSGKLEGRFEGWKSGINGCYRGKLAFSDQTLCQTGKYK